MYMLWLNFFLGLNFIFFCFELIIIHYQTQKQKKIKFKPRRELNHNIYIVWGATHSFIQSDWPRKGIHHFHLDLNVPYLTPPLQILHNHYFKISPGYKSRPKRKKFWEVNKVHYVKMVNGNLSRRSDIFT